MEAKNTETTVVPPEKRVYGFVKKGFEKVANVFKYNLETGFEKGGNFAAYYKGELVVSIWGGFADEDAGWVWDKDTITCCFSATKGVSACVIAHLVDRGLLDYDELVCKYWPEFAQNGKDQVTLKHLLSHQAGLPGTREPLSFKMVRDNPREVGRILAEARPLWKLGEGWGYHPLTFGILLDQVVRRVDSKYRSLSQYFKEEIAEPFGIDFHIGLPNPLHYRTARMKLTNVFDASVFMGPHYKGDVDVFSVAMKTFTDFGEIHHLNAPAQKDIPEGSMHGYCPAEALAKLYGILSTGGEYGNKQLLSKDLIVQLSKPIIGGYGKTYGFDAMNSLGFQIIGIKEKDEFSFIFGHPGFGGQFGGCDPNYEVGFAYCSNYLDPGEGITKDSLRFVSLYNALFESIFLAEEKTHKRETLIYYSKFIEAGGKLDT